MMARVTWFQICHYLHEVPYWPPEIKALAGMGNSCICDHGCYLPL